MSVLNQGLVATVVALILSLNVLAADTIEVNGGAVDHASLSVASIDPDAQLQVHPFDSTQADLGRAKHRDTAERVATTIPHLLAVDIVEAL